MILVVVGCLLGLAALALGVYAIFTVGRQSEERPR